MKNRKDQRMTCNPFRNCLREVKTVLFWRDCFCEAFLTFILLGYHIGAAKRWGDGDVITWLQIGLPAGLLVFVLVEALGHVSGAHFNPAVTMGFLCACEMSLIRAFFYMVFQNLGALAGSYMVYLLVPPHIQKQMSPVEPGKDMTVWQALIIEIFMTMTYLTVCLGASDKKNRNTFMPGLPIGVTVAINITVLGSFSGGSMNPAINFGPAVVMNKWTHHWIYWVGPLSGAALAAIIYKHIFINLGTRFKQETPTEESQVDDIDSEKKINFSEMRKDDMKEDHHIKSIEVTNM